MIEELTQDASLTDAWKDKPVPSISLRRPSAFRKPLRKPMKQCVLL